MTRGAAQRIVAVRCGTLLLCGLLLSGCATHGLQLARSQFYAGRLPEAETALGTNDVDTQDKVLVLMERGMVRQARGDYPGSSEDWITAYDETVRLRTYSVSKGAASFVVNDNVQPYQGVPFERTMLHDFTALNHLALGDWDNAAVESRRIITSLNEEFRGDYPDDAFSRYVAGFGLEMIHDDSNAAIQYRHAGALAPRLVIDENTGRIAPRTDYTNAAVTGVTATVIAPLPPGTPAEPNPWPETNRWPAQLVCFVLLGRSPSGASLSGGYRPYAFSEYAELYAGGQYLGRSYTLADVADLAFDTEAKEAVRKALKAAARVAVKEGIAVAVDASTDNQGWGDLVRLILMSLEEPDIRRWETMPRWLQVARVPCPRDLKEFEARIRNEYGGTRQTLVITAPLTRRGNTFFSFFRDVAGPAAMPVGRPTDWGAPGNTNVVRLYAPD